MYTGIALPGDEWFGVVAMMVFPQPTSVEPEVIATVVGREVVVGAGVVWSFIVDAVTIPA